MGAEIKYVVVYEIPTKEFDTFYGVTAQEAMQVLIDNGPVGARPLYAYEEDRPDITYEWAWG